MTLSYFNAVAFDRSGSGSYNFDVTIDPGMVSNTNSVLIFVAAIAGQAPGGGTMSPSTHHAVWVAPSSTETTLGDPIILATMGTDLTQGDQAIAVGVNLNNSTSLNIPNGGTLRLTGSSGVSASISAAIAVGVWDVPNASALGFFQIALGAESGNPTSGNSGTVSLTSFNPSLGVDSGFGYGVGVAPTGGAGSFSYSGDGWTNYAAVSHSGNYGTVHAEMVFTTTTGPGVPWTRSSASFANGFTTLGSLVRPATGGVRRRGMVIG